MSARRILWATAISVAFAACDSTINPDDAGFAFPCVYDGGADQCPAGALCGANNRCHPNAPGPWGCAIQSDCVGWHCGVEHVCYPLDAGDLTDGGYPCASSQDCTLDSRCGLNGHCHAVGVPGSYPCRSDLDCEAQWRCGPDGYCLDPSVDELPKNVFTGAVGESRVNPLWSARPDLVTAAAPSAWTGDGFSCGASLAVPTHVALLGQGHLTHLRVCLSPLGSAGLTYVDGVEQAAGILPPAASLAEAGNRAFVLADGGVAMVEFDGGTPAPVPVAIGGGFRPKQLRGISDKQEFDPLVVAFDDQRLFVFHLSEPSSGFFDAGTVLGFPVFDVAPMEASEPGLMVATDGGMFIAPRRSYLIPGPIAFFVDDAGTQTRTPVWQPVSPGVSNNVVCNPAFGSTDVRIRALYPLDVRPAPVPTADLVVEGVPLSGGPPNLSPIETVIDNNNGTTGACPAATWPEGGKPVYFHAYQNLPQCGACPAGTAATYATLDGGYRLHCEGGPPQQVLESNRTACVSPQPASPLEQQLLSTFVRGARSDLSPLVLATDTGLTLETLGTLVPLTLSSAPRVAVGTRGAPVATDPQLSSGPGTVFTLTPGLGLLSTATAGPQSQLVGRVEGRPDWQVTEVANPEPVALGVGPIATARDAGFSGVLQLGGLLQRWPVTAVANALSDGGTLIVMGVHDSIYAAEQPPPGQPPAAFHLRAVPMANANIFSLSVLAPRAQTDGGTPYVEGYGISDAQVFHFSAPGPFVWSVEPLVLSNAEPVKSWANGARGRIGFRDGTVFAVPTRTLIAPPLPPSAGVANDFDQLCGQPLALGDDALYRLTPGADGGVGSWTSMALSALPPLPGLTPYRGGRLYAADDAVFVFTAAGASELVMPASGSCPP